MPTLFRSSYILLIRFWPLPKFIDSPIWLLWADLVWLPPIGVLATPGILCKAYYNYSIASGLGWCWFFLHLFLLFDDVCFWLSNVAKKSALVSADLPVSCGVNFLLFLSCKFPFSTADWTNLLKHGFLSRTGWGDYIPEPCFLRADYFGPLCESCWQRKSASDDLLVFSISLFNSDATLPSSSSLSRFVTSNARCYWKATRFFLCKIVSFW